MLRVQLPNEERGIGGGRHEDRLVGMKVDGRACAAVARELELQGGLVDVPHIRGAVRAAAADVLVVGAPASAKEQVFKATGHAMQRAEEAR